MAVLAAGGVTEMDQRRGAGAAGGVGGVGSATIAGSRRCVFINVVVAGLCGGGGGVLIMALASATAEEIGRASKAEGRCRSDGRDSCGGAVRRAMRWRPRRANRSWIA